MSALQAYAKIKSLGVLVVSTSDVAAVLQMSLSAASHTLERLATAQLILRIRNGLWSMNKDIDPFALPEYLTLPQPSYISLHSALYRHGIVDQIPSVIYAVTLGKSQKVKTSVGMFSIHHIAPEIYDGYKIGEDSVKIAMPEKAMFDYAYLAPTNAKCRSVPEFELSAKVKKSDLKRWLRQIPSLRSQTLTAKWMEKLWGVRL